MSKVSRSEIRNELRFCFANSVDLARNEKAFIRAAWRMLKDPTTSAKLFMALADEAHSVAFGSASEPNWALIPLDLQPDDL